MPPNALAIDETLYGHDPGYYFLDEDTTNDVDETPPDVHFELGLHCADCHVGSDVHGDGRLWSSSKRQVDIRCEDCHGTARAPVVPDADGVRHVVPQPTEVLALGGSEEMHAAMAPDERGWSHTDLLSFVVVEGTAACSSRSRKTA